MKSGPAITTASLDNGDNAPRPWGRLDSVVAGGLLVYVVAAARTIISWDSHLYLASAKSLFWPEMTRWYHWIREPLYPFQIRASTALFGSTDLGLVLIQATLVVVAASFLVSTWFGRAPVLRKVALVIIAANPIVIGMVGFVGQQALMLALVCFGVGWVRLCLNPVTRSTGFVMVSAALGAGLALASAILVPLVLAMAAYPILRSGWSDEHPSRSSVDARRQVVRPSLALVFGAVIALSAWWAYKAVATSDTESAYDYELWMWEYTGRGNQFSAMQKVLGLLSLGPDGTIPPGAVAFELVVFGGLEEPFSDRCGFIYPGDIASEYAEGYLELSCRPAWADGINRSLGRLGLALHRGALLALVLATLAAAVIQRMRLVALVVIAFLMPYVVGGLGISRYSVPLYPLGICVMLGGFAAVLNTGRELYRRRKRVGPGV